MQSGHPRNFNSVLDSLFTKWPSSLKGCLRGCLRTVVHVCSSDEIRGVVAGRAEVVSKRCHSCHSVTIGAYAVDLVGFWKSDSKGDTFSDLSLLLSLPTSLGLFAFFGKSDKVTAIRMMISAVLPPFNVPALVHAQKHLPGICGR
jgi:hypothetical protein